ncbi:TetR family transcriptional regulator C-terminal domain-containing protein [Nocardia sp. GAS34]|uniref:TetR family transcriptional regulator C-terminal domain-containing protein n=1 Tax=unclassified Nocardia TaxID=2637762 RepID=UPI003D19F3D7
MPGRLAVLGADSVDATRTGYWSGALCPKRIPVFRTSSGRISGHARRGEVRAGSWTRPSSERIIARGQRQGVFREVDAEHMALRFTAMTDGLGIQVLTGVPGVTTTVMREVLIGFVRDELLVARDRRDVLA